MAADTMKLSDELEDGSGTPYDAWDEYVYAFESGRGPALRARHESRPLLRRSAVKYD